MSVASIALSFANSSGDDTPGAFRQFLPNKMPGHPVIVSELHGGVGCKTGLVWIDHHHSPFVEDHSRTATYPVISTMPGRRVLPRNRGWHVERLVVGAAYPDDCRRCLNLVIFFVGAPNLSGNGTEPPFAKEIRLLSVPSALRYKQTPRLSTRYRGEPR